jgi:hypothetical protein
MSPQLSEETEQAMKAAWQRGHSRATLMFVFQGSATALRQALRDVLSARGIAVDEGQQEAIAQERDVDVLRPWLCAASNASTAAEVFEASFVLSAHMKDAGLKPVCVEGLISAAPAALAVLERAVERGAVAQAQQALLDVLAARDLNPDDASLALIRNEKRLVQLRGWLRRALRARSLDGVLAEERRYHARAGREFIREEFCLESEARGFAEGAEEMAERGHGCHAGQVLLIVLKARGLATTPADREMIEREGDLERVHAWIRRASTAASVSEVLQGD